MEHIDYHSKPWTLGGQTKNTDVIRFQRPGEGKKWQASPRVLRTGHSVAPVSVSRTARKVLQDQRSDTSGEGHTYWYLCGSELKTVLR